MLAERLNALERDQEKWKSRVDQTEKTTPDSVKKNGLQQRLDALSERSNDWKKRVRADEEVNKLNSNYRLQKSGLISNPKTVVQETPKSRLFSQRSIPSSAPPMPRNDRPKTQTSPLDDVKSNPILTTPRRNVPKAPGRRLPSQMAQKQSSFVASTTLININHYDSISEDSSKENKENLLYISTGITPSCSQQNRTPKIGVDNCGIVLRKVEHVNPYPELMLVRFKGAKFVDVRLVSPISDSVTPCATFLLITPKKLFVYHGEYTSVLEKARAAQMACDIITGKEVCSAASKAENVQELPSAAAEFWRLLGGRPESSERLEIPKIEQILVSEGIGFEDYIKEKNAVFQILEDESIEEVDSKGIPRAALFNSSKVLVFDFETEVYVWIGRFSDRSLVKFAVEYAENLKLTRGNHSWMLIRKINEGLNDCLFRYKFPDWKSMSPKMAETPKWKPSPLLISPPRKKLASPGIEEPYKDDSELAEKLSDCFAFDCRPQEHVLILEDTELRTSDKNVFTEDLRYYQLVGEVLEEMEALDEFFDDECYVIEWKYRVERIGIRKLDGTPGRDHETGRQRVAFFYWLGKNTTKKEQGLCALALRNRDKDRHEHIRIEQGSEPPMLVGLFAGKLLISSKNEENSSKQGYLIRGSSQGLCLAEELGEEEMELRAQTSYIFVERQAKKKASTTLLGRPYTSGKALSALKKFILER